MRTTLSNSEFSSTESTVTPNRVSPQEGDPTIDRPRRRLRRAATDT